MLLESSFFVVHKYFVLLCTGGTLLKQTVSSMMFELRTDPVEFPAHLTDLKSGETVKVYQAQNTPSHMEN